MYTAPPLGPDDCKYARAQVRLWADPVARTRVIRHMYRIRLGEILPVADITVLRGIEGVRTKETYMRLAQSYGISWKGRFYDRKNPEVADAPNQAINHASTAVEAAATIAVAATGTIPQLGFIHEDSANSFTLDIADLYRDSITIPVAFQGVRIAEREPGIPLERHVRRLVGERIHSTGLIPSMIEKIKELIGADDGCGNT